MSEQPKQQALPPRLSLLRVVTRFWYLHLVLTAAALVFAYWWTFYAFTDRGYQPPQPVPYSHRLHAGKLGLDCQYCHYNAERGKHAGVPPATVCLGCHDPDQGAVKSDSELITALRAMIDVENPSYAYADGDDLDGRDEGTLKEGGVPHWNRVHILPDHVYFRHEAHVKAGVSCQTCHGPVQDMEVVYQYAPLTMGWCMDCHRNDNYVGGLEYDAEDQTTFSVGSANRTVKKLRVRPDDVVPFVERHTKGYYAKAKEGHGDHGHAEQVQEAGQEHVAHLADASHDDCETCATSSSKPGASGTQQGGQAAGQSAHDSFASSDAYGGGGHDHSHQHQFTHHLRYGYDSDEDDKLGGRKFFTQAMSDELAKFFAQYPDLPRWKVPNLPEVHAQLYYTEEDKAAGKANIKDLRSFDTFQNAPTDCSTCHQ